MKSMNGKIASETFLNGFNCAQSVVSSFGPGLGISRELSLKLANGLGAGGNYNGKICGAVMGAFIILGLRYGTDSSDNIEARELLRSKLNAFSECFKKEFGSIECNDLLKTDVSKPENLQKLRDENVFHKFCTGVVSRAAEIVESIITDSHNQ